jgi:hypothetical protein
MLVPKSALNIRKSKALSAIVDRVQTRFKEDPDRFEIVKPKRSYNQNINQMQPPHGPSSANPGAWVPETLTNAWMLAKQHPEKLATLPQLPEYKHASIVRDSYRQYVFGPVMSSPADDSPRFPMLEQPNVLSGKSWLESDVRKRSLYKLTRHAEELESKEDIEHEESLYCLDDEREVVDADEPKYLSDGPEDEQHALESSPSVIPISDHKMDVVYRTWFSNPTPTNRQNLWETLDRFFNGKQRNDDLCKHGESEDFLNGLVLRLMKLLDKMQFRGKLINQPAHYLTRTWNNCRKTALEKLTKKLRKWPNMGMSLAQDDGSPSNDEENVAPTHSDLAEYQRWQSGNNEDQSIVEDQEAADAATRERREAKLSTLDPDLADVIGMHIAGLKQHEIGRLINISQQAVSKKLIKEVN